MKILIRNFILLIIIFPLTSWALSTDKQQPAYIEADSASLNHKTGICIYRGNVKLTQGSTTIIADTLTTYLNAQNQLQQATAIGQLATYTTLPDNTKLPFTAVAQTINYYPIKSSVELIGQAKATQGSDSFAGPKINYDIKQQIVITPPSQGGRTTIIIQPQQKMSLPN